MAVGGRGLVTVTTHSSASPARNTGPRLSSATTSIMSAPESDLGGNKAGQKSAPRQGGVPAWSPGVRTEKTGGQHHGVGGQRLPLGAGGGWEAGASWLRLPRRRASLRVPAALPSLSTWLVPRLPEPPARPLPPFPQGSASRPQTTDTRHLAPAAPAPRQVETGGLGARRPSPVRPSRPGPAP